MVGQSVQAWAQIYCNEVSKLESIELITGMRVVAGISRMKKHVWSRGVSGDAYNLCQ